MHNFRNILFVSTAEDSDAPALRHALGLACKNEGTVLRILVLSPALPESFGDKREDYANYLRERVKSMVDDACHIMDGGFQKPDISIEMETKDTPAVRVVRQVLRGRHDMVVKKADIEHDGRGYSAFDMGLLRSCPCPVWLCKPIEHSQDVRVAVAIDPSDTQNPAHDLSLKLLKRGRALSDAYNGALDIIACWDYEFEETLRHNPWLRVPEDELKQSIEHERASNRAALDSLIEESGIGGQFNITHMRGLPQDVLPEFIDQHKIDILVMGTVARTGIAGFIFGNTAESIVRNIGCSLMAFKPDGFVSPIKAS